MYVDHRMANGDRQHLGQLQMAEGIGGRADICVDQNWGQGGDGSVVGDELWWIPFMRLVRNSILSR